MTDQGIEEKIVTTEIGLGAARAADASTVKGAKMGEARGEETEIIEAEQIVTFKIEQETKTIVTSMLNRIIKPTKTGLQ